MAAVKIRRTDLVVTLSGLERVAALRREIRVPMSCVRSVCADPDPWGALRGSRALGTGIPGVAAYGVRRMTGRRPDFAALHGRGPALRVELGAGASFGRLIVTVADPAAAASAVARASDPGGHAGEAVTPGG